MKDFDLRKSVHVKLMKETHAEFRVLSFRKKLSMQEMFEEFAQRAIVGDPSIEKILQELAERKREGKIQKLSKEDSDSLFDLIEGESPLGNV
tara:strand:- start:981 stop:1256 length:276 start_codon:yes stop_codon:yes gene_type:complete